MRELTHPADDPILTAYALGELSGVMAEEVEARLERDPEARRFVEATRAFASRLRVEFQSPSEDDLTPDQKRMIAEATGPKTVPFRRSAYWVPAVGIAAAITFAALYLADRLSTSPQQIAATAPIAAPVEIPAPAFSSAEKTEAEAATSVSPAAQEPGAAMVAATPVPSAVPSSMYGDLLAGNAREELYANEPSGPDSRWADATDRLTKQILTAPQPERYAQQLNRTPVLTEGFAGSFSQGDENGGTESGKSGFPGVAGEATMKGGLAGLMAGRGAGAPDSARRFRDKMPAEPEGTESYNRTKDSGFLQVESAPLSTFSIDVDTASYSNVRRFLTGADLPPRDAVRIEELINYFDYDYGQPRGGEPFAVNVEVADAPWHEGNKLARVGLKGRILSDEERPACNLVFLIDVSGSMRPDNRLPLIKDSLLKLVDRLRPDDRVAIVTYAGASEIALPSTMVDEKRTIIKAIRGLDAGGSTNGEAGIGEAYRIAEEHYAKGAMNRVILCTDGDFNVGVSDQGELVRLIARKAKSGVFLTVLGFGMGNLKDGMLEQIADKGNGAYGYIDNAREAHRYFSERLTGTLVTIAKDVKIQVEFNPAMVRAYRLVGYENRHLADRDFNDDTKDAGEIGAGHTVTALYEIVPARGGGDLAGVDGLKYWTAPPAPAAAPVATGGRASTEWMTVKLRYKAPDGSESKLIEQAVPEAAADLAVSEDFQFAAAVAQFGMLLRGSEHRGDATWSSTLELASAGVGRDPRGHRAEFLELIRTATKLSRDRD